MTEPTAADYALLAAAEIEAAQQPVAVAPPVLTKADSAGDDFAAILHSKLAGPAPQESALPGDSAPRSPRPDPSQASGANGPTAADPAAEFASFLTQQIGR